MLIAGCAPRPLESTLKEIAALGQVSHIFLFDSAHETHLSDLVQALTKSSGQKPRLVTPALYESELSKASPVDSTDVATELAPFGYVALHQAGVARVKSGGTGRELFCCVCVLCLCSL